MRRAKSALFREETPGTGRFFQFGRGLRVIGGFFLWVFDFGCFIQWFPKARKHEEIVSAKTPEEYAAENEHLKTALKEKEVEILVLQDALSFFVKRRKK